MPEKITLDEFCILKSKIDRRVEMIAGFHFYMEKQKKIIKATQTEFGKAFEDFSRMPA